MKARLSFHNVMAALLLFLGLTRMVGYFLGNRPLQGIGAASGIAPYTKVFCSAEGYEAFTARFWVRGQKADGSTEGIVFTPELYTRLRGPYMRRNVYGAALVFAPRLPAPLREAVHAKALRPDGPMWRELGLPRDWKHVSIEIEDRDGHRWSFTSPES